MKKEHTSKSMDRIFFESQFVSDEAQCEKYSFLKVTKLRATDANQNENMASFHFSIKGLIYM